jgi:hypothetical protein
MEKILRKIWQIFVAKAHKNIEIILDAIKDTDAGINLVIYIHILSPD